MRNIPSILRDRAESQRRKCASCGAAKESSPRFQPWDLNVEKSKLRQERQKEGDESYLFFRPVRGLRRSGDEPTVSPWATFGRAYGAGRGAFDFMAEG
ncbi:MAG TPA: hypothetical protein VE344_06760 [Methylomirabilota bacterium]|nr:hypothetical protein [Methylomirabilota bacterium]